MTLEQLVLEEVVRRASRLTERMREEAKKIAIQKETDKELEEVRAAAERIRNEGS